MPNKTKEKILESALKTFSDNGFSGTNIKDIAESVGIVKSALYRHYESKEDVWNAVFDMMESYYEEKLSLTNNFYTIPKTTQELYEITMKMVRFTIYDEKIVMARKILLTEQFHDERIKNLATRYFVDDMRNVFTKVFTEMIANGTIKELDVGFLSISYTAPITTLIHLCDREPERKDETITKIETFVKQFINNYKIKDDVIGG